MPNIKWGKNTRVVLDVGCGVASFGGYLFEKEVLTMSFAPKDEHEAQVQFALERGIPAISAVMGSQCLQFPSRVFDLIHCARCRVPWHEDGHNSLLFLFPFNLNQINATNQLALVHPLVWIGMNRDQTLAPLSIQICGSSKGPSDVGHECGQRRFPRYTSHNIREGSFRYIP